MRTQDWTADDTCLTCLKEQGIVMEITLPVQGVMSDAGKLAAGTYRASYRRLARFALGFRDVFDIEGQSAFIFIAYLPKGTTGRVISIPSVTAAKKKAAAQKAAKTRAAKARAAKKVSLETRLGLDKLNARVTTAKEPAKVRRSINASAKKRTATKA